MFGVCRANLNPNSTAWRMTKGCLSAQFPAAVKQPCQLWTCRTIPFSSLTSIRRIIRVPNPCEATAQRCSSTKAIQRLQQQERRPSPRGARPKIFHNKSQCPPSIAGREIGACPWVQTWAGLPLSDGNASMECLCSRTSMRYSTWMS